MESAWDLNRNHACPDSARLTRASQHSNGSAAPYVYNGTLLR